MGNEPCQYTLQKDKCLCTMVNSALQLILLPRFCVINVH
jgi:hypothetical protein